MFILSVFSLHCPIQDGKSSNIFMDCSSSEAWSAGNACSDIVPCLTPSHAVWSHQLRRFLTPVEHLGLQAVWEADVTSKIQFREMAESIGQDLAGNSFTGTVVQSVLLAQFASSTAWIDLDLAKNLHKQPDPKKQPTPGSQQHLEHRGKKRKAPEQGQSGDGNVVVRRLRGKQRPPAPPKKKRGIGGGNKVAKGKCAMATIKQKEDIFVALEEIQNSGVKNPLKELEKRNMKGFFKGCTYPSKWGRVRQEQNWPLLVKAAPELCSRHKELPNSLRSVMQIGTMKYSRGDDCSHGGLPLPLKEVVESIIMDRVENGEEVDTVFVRNTIVYCVDLWNECVHSIRGMVQSKSLELLKEHDQQYAQMTPKELDDTFKGLSERISSMLRTIHTSPHDLALMYHSLA